MEAAARQASPGAGSVATGGWLGPSGTAFAGPLEPSPACLRPDPALCHGDVAAGAVRAPGGNVPFSQGRYFGMPAVVNVSAGCEQLMKG